MKATKITYWIATAIVAIMMLYSAYAYITQPMVKQGFSHLGFPDYFRIELAVFKLIGAVVLLAPLSRNLKEWSYAGFAITFISAFIAHSASGDPLANRIMPLVFFIILIISYIAWHRQYKPLVTA